MGFLSDDIHSLVTSVDGRSRVIVSFRRETNSLAITEGYQEAILAKLMTLLANHTHEILVFCYQVPSDKDFNQQLFDAFVKKGFQCEFIQQKLSLQEGLNLYSKASLVLSNRLHILLPCIGLGTSHIGIIDKLNHHKILGIYRDAGLEDLLVDVNQSVDSQLLEKLYALFDYQFLTSLYAEQYSNAKQKIADILK
jgi:polysaccharide pyruvyl transferase WcaK-like protein